MKSWLPPASERVGSMISVTARSSSPLPGWSTHSTADAQLNDIGRYIANERMVLHTVNRLGYTQDRKQFPEIAEQRIERPVFIIGMPRTGTTILHDILAQDPASRAPLTWEVMFPSPPPRAATFDTDAESPCARRRSRP